MSGWLHRARGAVFDVFGRQSQRVGRERQAVARTWVVQLGFVAMLGGIGVRGAALCLAPDPEVVDIYDEQRWGPREWTAPRGDILDRHGRPLATTVDSPTVVADPLAIDPEDRARVAADLAEMLDRDAASVEAQLALDTHYVRLGRDVHPAVAAAVRSYPVHGVYVTREPKRYYPEQQLAAQVVGFVNRAGDGQAGLESALDSELSGGRVIVQRRRDRRGRSVDLATTDRDAAAGLTIATTIDRVIQRAAERALAGVVERHEPKSATAIAVDVHTGDILALANAPQFNPNAVDADPRPRRNHAVQDWYEPGSVMKPFTFAAAIEAGITDEHDRIDCENGAWFIGRSRIRDDHAKGVISATEVMKYSSNIGSAKMALELGPEVFIDSLRAFGFGQRTGVPLPGELSGRLRHPDRIRPIELATTAFGQGMTVTALQLAMGTAAIANGGELMRPRLVTAVTDIDGLPEWEQPPARVRRVVSEDTAGQVGRMMQAVMAEGGTGTRGNVPGYLAAGKTGTAQKPGPGGYGDARVSTFVGFLPADDPVVAIVVVVDEPSKGSRYGGTVAGPAFAEIGEAAMRAFDIAPNPELLEPAPALADADLPLDDAVAELDPLALEWAGEGWRVPDLSGRPLRDVLVGVEGAGLALAIDGSGRAVSQNPAPGAVVAPGQRVEVVFR